jgi:hypothetical protein
MATQNIKNFQPTVTDSAPQGCTAIIQITMITMKNHIKQMHTIVEEAATNSVVKSFSHTNKIRCRTEPTITRQLSVKCGTSSTGALVISQQHRLFKASIN